MKHAWIAGGQIGLIGVLAWVVQVNAIDIGLFISFPIIVGKCVRRRIPSRLGHVILHATKTGGVHGGTGQPLVDAVRAVGRPQSCGIA